MKEKQEMNPNEIKKALECCIKGKTRGDCEKLGCPAYRKEGCAYFLKSNSLYDEDAVHREMCKDALAYINQLEAEVEMLKEYENIRPVGCPNCHRGNFSNSKFCSHCGRQLRGKKKEMVGEQNV